MNGRPRKHVFRFAFRVMRLWFFGTDRTAELVDRSYDGISGGYDETWTTHMRERTADLVDRLDVRPGWCAADLTCGTGYATGLLAECTGQKVVGVDRSSGMLAEARRRHGDACEFVQSDVLEYLKGQPANSIDLVTCCWGLGYSRPLAVLRQIRRVLRPGGRVGIIDNTAFSLREVMTCSVLTFMECADKLENVMHFRFLTGKRMLGLWMRLAGLKPLALWSGEKSYIADDGRRAIARLQATGAAAGFEFAASGADSAVVFDRFAEIIEEKYRDAIPIIHRFAAGTARK